MGRDGGGGGEGPRRVGPPGRGEARRCGRLPSPGAGARAVAAQVSDALCWVGPESRAAAIRLSWRLLDSQNGKTEASR